MVRAKWYNRAALMAKAVTHCAKPIKGTAAADVAATPNKANLPGALKDVAPTAATQPPATPVGCTSASTSTSTSTCCAGVTAAGSMGDRAEAYGSWLLGAGAPCPFAQLAEAAADAVAKQDAGDASSASGSSRRSQPTLAAKCAAWCRYGPQASARRTPSCSSGSSAHAELPSGSGSHPSGRTSSSASGGSSGSSSSGRSSSSSGRSGADEPFVGWAAVAAAERAAAAAPRAREEALQAEQEEDAQLRQSVAARAEAQLAQQIRRAARVARAAQLPRRLRKALAQSVRLFRAASAAHQPAAPPQFARLLQAPYKNVLESRHAVYQGTLPAPQQQQQQPAADAGTQAPAQQQQQRDVAVKVTLVSPGAWTGAKGDEEMWEAMAEMANYCLLASLPGCRQHVVDLVSWGLHRTAPGVARMTGFSHYLVVVTKFYPSGDLNRRLRAVLAAIPKALDGDQAALRMVRAAAVRGVADALHGLAKALAAFGRNSIVSGDVKFANFVWDAASGTVRAIDVESFRLLDLAAPNGATPSPRHLCSWCYAAPELTDGELEANVLYSTTDVFSLRQALVLDALDGVETVLGDGVWIRKPHPHSAAGALLGLMAKCCAQEPCERPQPWVVARRVAVIARRAAAEERLLLQEQ